MKRRIWVVLAGISILIVVAFALIISKHAPVREAIICEVECNGRIHPFAMNTDGSHFRPLLWNDSCEAEISPDGKYIATSSGDRVYVNSAEGRRRLKADGYYASIPVFSPDARMIGIVSHKEDGTEVIIENVDGSGRHSFALSTAHDIEFSPDGKHIVVAAGEYPNYYIYLCDLSGDQKQVLARGESPVFSPDGKTVAFTNTQNGGGERIHLIDIDGKHERLLTRHSLRAFYPVFSPDGKKILFRSEDSRGDIGLYIINSDGSNQRRLSSGPLVSGAAFSPNGNRAAYSTESGVFVVSCNGGKPRLITGHGGGALYWGPVPPIHARPRPSCPGLPRGYYVDQIIKADYDGDGENEQACVAAAAAPPGVYLSEGNRQTLLVLVSKDNRLISRFGYKEKNRISGLNAVDLTGDGVPELTYDVELYGGSDGTIDFHARQWTGKTFSNIIGTPSGVLSHYMEGGVVAQKNKTGRPSTLILYDFIWGDGESHADAHRYWAEWYELRDGKFVRTKRRETQHKYGKNPLSEFGVHVPSSAAQQM